MEKESLTQFVRNRTRGILFGRTRLGDFINANYGVYLLLKYSFSINKLKSKDNYRAYLTKQYHIIEKGLSLPKPRDNFGKDKIYKLLQVSKSYIDKFGEDHLTNIIRNCLIEYLNTNESLQEVYPDLYEKLTTFVKNHNYVKIGGTKKISKAIIDKSTDIDFEKFVRTRTSVRDFSKEEVDVNSIKRAVNIARHAPSVCNRQAWKIHFYQPDKKMQTLLKLQAGNNGFSESIMGLCIITSDVKQFTKLEGNQIYTDGGIFSMNLVLSLHHEGIASCCLNTCVPYTTEKRIKKLAQIPANERLIMMIGVGKLKDEFKSAFSEKKPVNEILEIH